MMTLAVPTMDDVYTVDVLLPLKFDKLLTYQCELDASPGDYVTVPLRSGTANGIIWNSGRQLPGAMPYKKVARRLDIPPTTRQWRDFIDSFSKYNMCPRGMILKGLLKDIAKPDITKQAIATASASLDSIKLSDAQAAAADAILDSRNFNTIVLDGVTGSGKTSVYMAAINQVIKEGGQALVLLPEILLVSQLYSTLQKYSDTDIVSTWHSSIRSRTKVLGNIISGRSKIIMGARSALFLPYKNLKMIVVDEEHDSSYKQDTNVCYNARDMAIMRAKHEDIPIVLPSATPSMETMHNVISGKYRAVYLPRGFNDNDKPTVEVVDMKKEDSNISGHLIQAINKALEQKHQAMLFINRRGYCFLTICKQCGYKPQCPNCKTWLVEHQNDRKYRCHHCDFAYKISAINECPSCKAPETLKRFGSGIERVYEEVSHLFPSAQVAMISSDITRSNKKSADIVNRILSNQIDIIVGTQLIAKGHNFPNLALIGIIDADAIHHGVDLRTGEKTYQALRQVSGRVGRYNIPGRIVMQTHCPESILVQTIKEFDRDKFYEYELSSRKQSNMPPFTRLCCITLSSAKLEIAEPVAKAIAHALRAILPKESVMGPSPSPMPYINKRHRLQIIVRVEKKKRIQHYIQQAMSAIKAPQSVTIKVDIDPLNFM